ncbi:hypothetical protein [Pontibacterium sp.]|uniref:hypothetical protein n=1 Tax=Pontibacterium sp. TaxID=2036026 RepID=UPI00356B1EDE
MIKRSDLTFMLFTCAMLSPLLLMDDPAEALKTASHSSPLLASFIKFAILATYGEVLGLRIATGHYPLATFGVLPKAVVWGVFGICIKLCFVIYVSGVPVALALLGMEHAADALSGPLSLDRFLVAFAISVAMNLTFGVWLMTFHKITDLHINAHQGRLICLIRPLYFGKILTEINWHRLWSFVLKKTIPLFWIPCHTLTFLLPSEYRVLFAALLGIVLGLILAFGSRKPNVLNRSAPV